MSFGPFPNDPGLVGGMVAIADTGVLSADQPSIDFQNIPQTFKHLQLEFRGRSTLAANPVDNLGLRFNNDSTAGHYDYLLTQYDGATVAGETNAVTDQIRVLKPPAATGPAGSGGSVVIDIPDYTSAAFWQAVVFTGYAMTNVGRAITGGGDWKVLAAATRLTLITTANILAGSRATLYGKN